MAQPGERDGRGGWGGGEGRVGRERDKEWLNIVPNICIKRRCLTYHGTRRASEIIANWIIPVISTGVGNLCLFKVPLQSSTVTVLSQYFQARLFKQMSLGPVHNWKFMKQRLHGVNTYRIIWSTSFNNYYLSIDLKVSAVCDIPFPGCWIIHDILTSSKFMTTISKEKLK